MSEPTVEPRACPDCGRVVRLSPCPFCAADGAELAARNAIMGNPTPLPQRSPEAVRVMASEQLARHAVERYGAQAPVVLLLAVTHAGELLRKVDDPQAMTVANWPQETDHA